MTKEEIKETYSMRDIAARYGIRANRSGFIRCPFHEGDREPSMKLYEKDFHCHACGAHGDIIDFVMEMDNLTFKEAFLELGGTLEQDSESKKTAAMRIANIRRAKAERANLDKEFRIWRLMRLTQICRILQMLDVIIPTYPPLSDEWMTAMEMYFQNTYKYMVLTEGTREEQEEMRELNE